MSSSNSNINFSDKEIVEQIQYGDFSAYNLLVKRYSKRLSGVIFSIIKDEELTGDILQETYIKVYKNISKFQGKSSIITWMTKIAVNEALTQLKKSKRLLNKELMVIDEDLKDEDSKQTEYSQIIKNKYLLDDSHPEKIFVEKDQKEYINKVIDTLDAKHRLILRLKYYEDFTTKEISEIVNKPEGTVRSRLFYAREELKQKLSKVL